METFMKGKEAERIRARQELARNPCPGRPPKHHNRINRALEQIVERLRLHLSYSKFATYKWFPSEGIVTAIDDEWQPDLAATFEAGAQTEGNGHMVEWNDQGIKATNRIQVVTWYDRPGGEGFILKKPVYCPLPCSAWGSLPINLNQWRRCAPALIESRLYWQWVHSVRHYMADESFQVGGIVGWHMDLANPVTSLKKLVADGKGYVLDFRTQEEQTQDAEGWMGRNIYLDIIQQFSLDD